LARDTLKNFPRAIAISARSGTGINDLLHLIREELYESYTPIHIRLPYQQGALISLFHELGQVELVEHERGGVIIQGRIPGRLVAQFAPWMNSRSQAKPGSSEKEEDLEEV
jgi:GTP-binding protein HflX